MRTAILAGFFMAAFGFVLLTGLAVLPFATTSGTVTVINPVAVSASANPSSGNAPLTVTLSATATGGTGSGYSYSWSDGNGGTSVAASWSTTYSAPGTYTATVTVKDSAGNAGIGSATVTAGNPLTISCTFSPLTVTVGSPVTIQCSMSGGPAYYGWSASYGDGTTSGSQAVTSLASYSFSHIYSAAGTYTITVTGQAGLSSTGICSRCFSAVSSFTFGASSPISSSGGFTNSQYAGLGFLLGGIFLSGYGYRERDED